MHLKKRVSQSGTTLAETLVALVVLTIALTGIVSLLIQSLNLHNQEIQRLRTQRIAADAAEKQLMQQRAREHITASRADAP